MAQIRLDVDDSLYHSFKEECEKNDLKVLGVSRKLMEKAMKEYLLKAKGEQHERD